jgi:hypothetical protein
MKLFVPFKRDAGGFPVYHWELTGPDLELLHRRLVTKFGYRILELFDGIHGFTVEASPSSHPLPQVLIDTLSL